MTIVFCPEEECAHAPFPHRLVQLPARSVMLREPKWRKMYEVTYPAQEFVICSMCDHWIQCQYGTCNCPYKCHETAVSDREIARLTSPIPVGRLDLQVKPSQEAPNASISTGSAQGTHREHTGRTGTGSESRERQERRQHRERLGRTQAGRTRYGE